MRFREFLSAFGLVLTLGTAAVATGLSGTKTFIRGTSSANFNTTNSTFVNFITDAGATCNGVADDGPALANAGVIMRTAQAANPSVGVTLFIPSGSSCKWTTCPIASDGQQRPFANLTNFTFIATGATISGTGCTVYSNQGFLGADGSVPAVQHKFVTNLAGATCVTMVTAGTEANYPVGRWVVVAGEGMQVNSFPPNYAMWEFAQVASTPAGQVCLTAGLRNAYPDSTVVIDLCPNMDTLNCNSIANPNAANCSNITCGGQGTLVLLTPKWDTTFHFIGGSWNFTTELEWGVRTVTIDNMTVTSPGVGQNCYLASLSQVVSFNNPNWNGGGQCRSEMDKEVDQIIVNGGTLNGNFQSQSINTLTLNGGATYTGSFPLHTVCNNSTMTGNGGTAAHFGNAFGTQPVTFSGNGCNLPSGFTTQPAFANFLQILPNGGAGSGQFFYNGSSQFQRNPVNIYGGALPQWMSRNGRLGMGCCSGNGVDYGTHVTITGSQYSPLGATNGTLTASLTPSLGIASGNAPPPNSGTIDYSVIPAITVTCTGCTGGTFASDLNNTGAQSQLAFTYSKRTYTCQNNIANVPNSLDINAADDRPTILGALVSGKANVSVADSNPADSGLGILFDSGPVRNFNLVTGLENSSLPFYMQIDVLQTGTRAVTLTSTSGAVGADVLTAPGASTWLQGADGNFRTGIRNNNVTNGPAAQCPVVSFEWITTDS